MSRNDRPIIEALAEFQFLTVAQAAKLLGRHEVSVRRRMRQLFESGVLNRVTTSSEKSVPFLHPEPFVYFLDQRGGHMAAEWGALPEPRWIDSKSRLTVAHDLEITNYHLALKEALEAKGIPFEWKQWRGDLRDHAPGKEAIIPDAYFSFQNQSYFLEVVKSAESEYENGESNIERKVRLYTEYPKRFKERYGRDDFHVVFVMPTQARVLNLLAKLEDRFPYRRFYITHEDRYRADILGKSYWTPRDFRDKAYGLLG